MNRSEEGLHKPVVEFEGLPHEFEICHEDNYESQIRPVEVGTGKDGIEESSEIFFVVSLGDALLLCYFEKQFP